jgi:hypothetical protein
VEHRTVQTTPCYLLHDSKCSSGFQGSSCTTSSSYAYVHARRDGWGIRLPSLSFTIALLLALLSYATMAGSAWKFDSDIDFIFCYWVGVTLCRQAHSIGRGLLLSETETEHIRSRQLPQTRNCVPRPCLLLPSMRRLSTRRCGSTSLLDRCIIDLWCRASSPREQVDRRCLLYLTLTQMYRSPFLKRLV